MYRDFSSLPPNEEQMFVVFEQRSQEAAKAANKIGLIASLGLGGLILVIVLAFWGPVHAPGSEAGAEGAEKPAAAADER